MHGPAFPHPPLAGYALLDCGGGEKLERFGSLVLRRPDPQALWRRRLGAADWEAADLRFVRESDRGGRWEPRPGTSPPAEWELAVGGGAGGLAGLPAARMLIRPTPFKHVGLFPEQAANWLWVEERRRALAPAGAPLELLHLFAYTGAATLLAALAGWKVTHVDAARPALDWAAENARRSGCDPGAVRWMLEDAVAFAARAARRGRRYHGILLDPPRYGRGPRGERWRFEEQVAGLIESCAALLAPVPGAFLLLSTYAIGTSPLTLSNLLAELGPGLLEAGELAIPECGVGPPDSRRPAAAERPPAPPPGPDAGAGHGSPTPRLLPCGFCARFVRA